MEQWRLCHPAIPYRSGLALPVAAEADDVLERLPARNVGAVAKILERCRIPERHDRTAGLVGRNADNLGREAALIFIQEPGGAAAESEQRAAIRSRSVTRPSS